MRRQQFEPPPPPDESRERAGQQGPQMSRAVIHKGTDRTAFLFPPPLSGFAFAVSSPRVPPRPLPLSFTSSASFFSLFFKTSPTFSLNSNYSHLRHPLPCSSVHPSSSSRPFSPSRLWPPTAQLANTGREAALTTSASIVPRVNTIVSTSHRPRRSIRFADLMELSQQT